MSKATHNGTCQACGRKQAFSHSMAKHGYTTKWGYFAGTCSGSDRQPLELETSHNIKTVAAIRDWADEQDALANGNIETVTVQVKNPEAQARRYADRYIDVQMTRAEYIESERAEWQSDDQARWDEYNSDKFDTRCDQVRYGLRSNAKFARKDADLLDQLRDKTFGNELEARNTQPELQREYPKSLAHAYDRQKELKAEGIKATVRGGTYRQREIVITYRK